MATYDTDPDMVKYRGALGAALKCLNEKAAGEAAVKLVQAKKAAQLRRANELFAKADMTLDEVS